MFKFLSILLLTCFFTLPAQAHKVMASAWTDGPDIEGEVGFSSGIMAKNGTLIEVFDQTGNKMGESTVKEDGLFRFTPTKAVAHHFVANLGAGHVAKFVLTADELPDGLNQGPATPSMTTSPQTETTTQSPSLSSTEIARIVAKAVRKEVQPLRKEIATYKEKNDMQSILGGIGYILGLTGVAFYIAARRKESKNT